MVTIESISKRLSRLEEELEKIRGVEYSLPFGSMKRAKVSRKWDELAKARINLVNKLEEMKIESRKLCPAKMVCQCGVGGNWNGICKLNEK